MPKFMESRPGEQETTPSLSPDQVQVTRRQMIQTMALGCLSLVSTKTLAGIVDYTRKPEGPVMQGQFLSQFQMRLLRELVEVIIPQTETPGAAATDTHGFIDDQLAHCRSRDEAVKFAADLDSLDKLTSQHWGVSFADLSDGDRQSAMNAIARNEAPFESLPSSFFSSLKSLTVLGYYSSEAGASEELVYLPVPGGYKGDFKVSENDGRAFSPHAF